MPLWSWVWVGVVWFCGLCFFAVGLRDIGFWFSVLVILVFGLRFAVSGLGLGLGLGSGLGALSFGFGFGEVFKIKKAESIIH